MANRKKGMLLVDKGERCPDVVRVAERASDFGLLITSMARLYRMTVWECYTVGLNLVMNSLDTIEHAGEYEGCLNITDSLIDLLNKRKDALEKLQAMKVREQENPARGFPVDERMKDTNNN